MKVEYINRKGEMKMMESSEVVIDLESGHNLRIYEANCGPAVQIINKNSRGKLFDELATAWVKELQEKGEMK